MSRLTKLFEQKNKRVLNVYCTAGYPHLNSTIEVMESLQKNGADIIELGMPYSDPLADGEVIQSSSLVALNNGMTIDALFEQLATMRTSIHIPVVLMGYMNPILQYGLLSSTLTVMIPQEYWFQMSNCVVFAIRFRLIGHLQKLY